MSALAAAAATRLSLGGLAVVAALSVVGALDRAPWLPLLVGLTLGLPHGAVDHLVPEWLAGRRLPPRAFAVLLGVYVLTAGAFLAAVLYAPAPAVLAFLVLSVAHFGTGDLEFAAARDGREDGAPWRRPLAVVAFGGPPVLLPLAVWPERAGPVLLDLAPGLSWLLVPGVRAGLLVTVLGCAALTSAAMVRSGRRCEAAEVAALTACFLLVPPLPAFGVYFGCWHAARHLARLVSLDPRNAADLAEGRLSRPLRRFARSASLPTAASITVLALLWWGAGGAEGLVTAHLGLLAALTMPHVAVVAWLDRTAGAYGVPPAGGSSSSSPMRAASSSSWSHPR